MTLRHLGRHLIRRFLLLEDIKKYGFWATFKRLLVLRETWSEKGNKILVGKDKYGNTYWETTDSTEVREYQ